jgi:phosphoribosylamine--glycine ligase
MMQVLIVGSGGREHALACKCAQSTQVDKVFVAPGNAGTATEPGVENVALAANDIDGLLGFARERVIDLTIIGPEDPLVMGIVDRFHSAGLACFGPSAAAARLEGSKSFAKEFMQRHGIPTAEYDQFTDVSKAIQYVHDKGAPIVVKADGLAAGKGVVVAQTIPEAEAAVLDMLAGNAFGSAGHQVVIEEFLTGEEASFIVMADGKHVLPMATSQDHKAVGDGDKGPNTGGMGAYSPAPVVDAALHDRIMREIIQPVIDGMAADGHPFTGFLYAGLMITPAGEPKVIEFNVRFGDPETQPILQRLQSDLPELCLAALGGELNRTGTEWDSRCSLAVVMAAEGYPGRYGKGELISGLDHEFPDNVKVFQAGTALAESGIVTSGGRVLCVCALGDSVAEAQKAAYQGCTHIHWRGAFYRNDIGYRAIARERQNLSGGQPVESS